MRIGVLTGEYPPMQGGVGAYSQIIARTYAALGHEVFVFSGDDAQENHPDVRLVHPARRWGPLALRQARTWAHEHQLDVVNMQYEPAAYGLSPWVYFLPEALRPTPVVTTFHDLLVPYLFPKAGPLRDWMVMRLARQSAGVIATNHEDMARLRHLPFSRLIPIGSNIDIQREETFDRLTEYRTRAGAAPDDFLLAHFGFVNQSKGLETLMQAIASLRGEDVPVKLVMIGGRTGSSDRTNNSYADSIDQLIEDLGIYPDVSWTGYVDDDEVTAYLRAADAAVLPFRDGASFRRGSLMAALQHGCAIISTQPRVSVPEFIDDENMLLVPSENPLALAEAIKTLRGSYELREKLKQGALDAAQHFDWGTIAQNCVSLFRDVTRDDGSRLAPDAKENAD